MRLLRHKGSIHLPPQQRGINRILQQFPHENIPVIIQVFSHQEMQYLFLIHRKAKIAAQIPVRLNLPAAYCPRKWKFLPPSRPAIPLQPGTLIEFLIHPIQKMPDRMFYLRVFAASLIRQLFSGRNRLIRKTCRRLMFFPFLTALFIICGITVKHSRRTGIVEIQQIGQT